MAEQPTSPIPSVPPKADGDRPHVNGESTSASPKPAPATKKLYFASIEPGLDTPLPASSEALAQAVIDYEAKEECEAWVIIQSDTESNWMDDLDRELTRVVLSAGKDFETKKKIVVFLHTHGGQAEEAYRIATFLQKKAGSFELVVPRMAKSAGTLMALGAKKIIMGQMAELGPLDMQVWDPESEQRDSALNETKSLQTLSREALILYTAKMAVLKNLYPRKSFETRNRIATEFVNEMIQPLVKKINAVHYTKMARIMEIMKKYGESLLGRAGYPASGSKKIVEKLSEEFPDHSYIIDCRDAKALGLRAEHAKPDLVPFIETMAGACGGLTIIGKISSVETDGN